MRWGGRRIIALESKPRHVSFSIWEALSWGWITSHSAFHTKGVSWAMRGSDVKVIPYNADAVMHLAVQVKTQPMPTRNDISFIRSLRDRNTRHMERKFVVEGHKCVAEALESGWPIHGLFSTEASGCPVSWNAEPIQSKDMDRMSAFKTAPGILAIVGMPDVVAPSPEAWSVDEASVPFGLVVDGLSDPGNLGTLLRTADWFGLKGIWVSRQTVDVFNAKAIQASMGAVFRVDAWAVDLPELVVQLEESSSVVFGLDMEGDALWSLKGAPSVGRKWCAIVGSESHGLSEAVREACPQQLHIPGAGGSESLNASMAAGIVLSDWSRRTQTS